MRWWFEGWGERLREMDDRLELNIDTHIRQDGLDAISSTINSLCRMSNTLRFCQLITNTIQILPCHLDRSWHTLAHSDYSASSILTSPTLLTFPSTSAKSGIIGELGGRSCFVGLIPAILSSISGLLRRSGTGVSSGSPIALSLWPRLRGRGDTSPSVSRSVVGRVGN